MVDHLRVAWLSESRELRLEVFDEDVPGIGGDFMGLVKIRYALDRIPPFSTTYELGDR